jgi:putative lipoic acid-binding regulatory protein
VTRQGDQGVLEFPCSFPIKAMGLSSGDFVDLVVSVVRRHVDDLGEGAVRVRESRGGKYTSVTVTFTARSRSQLDDLYRELTSDERILVVL